ncbi:type II toxin-antitoxin system PemK/MazF family toxin [Pseudomonas monteilii]
MHTQLALPYNPLPESGDIVWAMFPNVETLGIPGPKPRPALVLFISDEDHAIQVAYGTSQRTDRLYRGEFVLDPHDQGFSLSGLSVRTKFDLSRVVTLPFNSDWFAPDPGIIAQSPLPKMGTLHASYMIAVNDAWNQLH